MIAPVQDDFTIYAASDFVRSWNIGVISYGTDSNGNATTIWTPTNLSGCSVNIDLKVSRSLAGSNISIFTSPSGGVVINTVYGTITNIIGVVTTFGSAVSAQIQLTIPASVTGTYTASMVSDVLVKGASFSGSYDRVVMSNITISPGCTTDF